MPVIDVRGIYTTSARWFTNQSFVAWIIVAVLLLPIVLSGYLAWCRIWLRLAGLDFMPATQ